jgi:hypothetical protein
MHVDKIAPVTAAKPPRSMRRVVTSAVNFIMTTPPNRFILVKSEETNPLAAN